jgi:hypothetical protein
MLNPDFFTDPDIVSLDPFGRLFYQGLWCVADDSGCFELNTLYLKMKIFPGDNISLDDIQGYIDTLIKQKKLVTYHVDGKDYAWLKNFHKHQKLDKPSPPSVPLPPWVKFHGEEEFGNQRHKWYYEIIEPVGDNSGTCRGNVVDETTPEVNRREEKRSEGERNRKDSPNPPGPDPSPVSQQLIDDGQKEPKYTEDSPPYRAAMYLRNRILENNPRARVPDDDPGDPLLQKWAQEMDRLNRIGPPGGKQGYSWQEVKQLIDFSQDDEFWRANILSAGKLREKCVQLENQMKRQFGREPPGARGMTMSKNVANALRLVEKYSQEKGDYP